MPTLCVSSALAVPLRRPSEGQRLPRSTIRPARGLAVAVHAGRGDVTQMVPSTLPPQPPPNGLFGGQGATVAIIALQAVGLVGAFVTGTLARKRRQEIVEINAKLRQINAQLRLQSVDEGGQPAIVPSEAEMKAIREYRASLKEGFAEQSAALGEEAIKEEEQRQQLLAYISRGRAALDAGKTNEALEVLAKAQTLSKEAEVLPATRAILRIKAEAYRADGNLREAVDCLIKVLAVSMAMEEYSGDADVYGEIADLYTELGDMAQAGEYYDRCIDAITVGQPSNLSSTWDMA